MAHLSAHLSLCPAKGVRSFLAIPPCPQLDLEGALQRTGLGERESVKKAVGVSSRTSRVSEL